MQTRRLIYQNWIVDLGFDPSNRATIPSDPWVMSRVDITEIDREQVKRTENLRKRVTESIERLDQIEREFIRLYYYLGFSYKQISYMTGRQTHKLEALHKRSLNRLRLLLSTYAEDKYGIKSKPQTNCPVCSSNERDQIDEIIESRDKTETWKPVMRKIREQCGLHLRSPQILIGHEKYHIKETEKKV